MTDLEMTRLCARAYFAGRLTCMPALQITQFEDGKTFVEPDDEVDVILYDPLHDDAQAMALEDWLIVRGLVRYFGDRMEFVQFGAMRVWSMNFTNKTERRRAIVECVAQMQLERTKSAQSGGQSEDKQLTKVG